VLLGTERKIQHESLQHSRLLDMKNYSIKITKNFTYSLSVFFIKFIFHQKNFTFSSYFWTSTREFFSIYSQFLINFFKSSQKIFFLSTFKPQQQPQPRLITVTRRSQLITGARRCTLWLINDFLCFCVFLHLQWWLWNSHRFWIVSLCRLLSWLRYCIWQCVTVSHNK